MKYTIFKNI